MFILYLMAYTRGNPVRIKTIFINNKIIVALIRKCCMETKLLKYCIAK